MQTMEIELYAANACIDALSEKLMAVLTEHEILKSRLIRHQLDEAAAAFMLRHVQHKLTICAIIALFLGLLITRWIATTIIMVHQQDWD